MTDTFKSDTDLDIALEKLCDLLCEKGAMKPEDKFKAKEEVKKGLQTVYGEGGTKVPQDLFTDPSKRQNLIVALVTAPVMGKIPALKFDLGLFFKAQLKPEETKKLFKAFMIGLNKLEPDPNKRIKDEDIDKEVDALLEKFAQAKLKKGKETKSENTKAVDDELDEMFQVLFGITRYGALAYLTVNRGNVAGIIDSYSASALGGGSIHESRDFGGDTTTNPYITALAHQRLSAIAGIGEAILKELRHDKIIKPTSTPTLNPFSKL